MRSSAALRRLNPFLRLSIHSFNVECVLGYSVLPRSWSGKWVLGAFSTSLLSVQATAFCILAGSYVWWVVSCWRRREWLRGPWTAPSYATLGSTWVSFLWLFNGALLSGSYAAFWSYGESYLELTKGPFHLELKDVSWFKLPSVLFDDIVPSARLVAPRAEAAPPDPRAQPEQLGGLPLPQQPARLRRPFHS